MKRTPFPRRAQLHRSGQLRHVGRKRAQQNRTYTRLRAEYLAGHPRCEFPGGCVQPATEIQHRRGRSGERLLDTDWWAASCHAHNQWAETHTGAALTMGWLVPIEGAA